MKRVDFYVQHLVRHSATGVVITSGKPVAFQFPSGERTSNNPIDHNQVAALVKEIAPPDAVEALRTTRSCSFDHAGDQLTVTVEVEAPGRDDWKVTISPASAGGRSPLRRPAAVGLVGGVANAAAAPKSEKPPASRPAPRASFETGGSSGEAARIERMLRLMIEIDASDLHLCTGVVPMVRVHGEMQPLEERGPFEEDELSEILHAILPERNRKEFEETSDTDFAHTIEGLARFRANYFRDRRGVGAVFRQIPFDIMTPDQLGLPKQVLDLCYLTKGLVLVTGPTGSGKSTTLATLIDVINQQRPDHIITIEDPIEFVHKNKRCLVNQREVGTHTQGFKKALRAALREDPDIVLVGEMRDLETIAIAIETAETGHLVFGTLHTTTAPSTVDRIIDQFPPDRQAQIRTMLSESLKGVIAQVLCKRKGGGRVAAYEVLIANSAVSNLIREGKTYQLVSTMQTGKAQGMQTLNEHLLHHVKEGLVEPLEAYMKASDKRGFSETLKRAGINFEMPT
ncbi:MAG: type IV pilus twitching motility protein PilT [Sandaracinaceae bacterium]